MENIINEYFKSLNPLATKISLEREEIIHKYRSEWKELSDQEQEAIIDNYFFLGKTIESIDLQKLLKFESGVKVVVDFHQDDMGWTWTDEHSGPFSWKTKSQQDLTLSNLDQISEEESRRRSLSRKERANIQKVDSTKKKDFSEIESKPLEDDVFIRNDKQILQTRISGNSNKGVQEIIKDYDEPVGQINPIKDVQRNSADSPIRSNRNVTSKVMSLRALKNVRSSDAESAISEPTSPLYNPVVTKQPASKTGFDFLDNW